MLHASRISFMVTLQVDQLGLGLSAFVGWGAMPAETVTDTDVNHLRRLV